MINRFLTWSLIVSGFLVAPSGCRAIRRTVASGQSIEARRLSREGLAAIHQGEWIDAEELFESALKLSQSDERAFWGYGEVLWHKDLRDEAIPYVEKAVKLSAGDPELLLRLGNMYLEQGKIDEAEEVARRVRDIDHSLSAAWALEGDVFVRRGRPEEALASYHRALSIDRQNERVRHSIAEIYRDQKRYDRLLATLDPVSEDSLEQLALANVELLRGVAMRELGQPGKGSQHIARAIALGLRDPDTLIEYASSEYSGGKVASASEAVSEALIADPANPKAIQLASQIDDLRARVAVESSETDTQRQ